MRDLPPPCRVKVVTDSKYVTDAFHKGWLKNWQKNGWQTAAKKPVKNRDLWEDLIYLVDLHEVTFEWIRGHTGHTENERADKLAVEARDNAAL